jgi:peptide/nickel transport system permease protein
MINENRIGLTSNVWGVAVPIILIAILTIGISTLTDAVARIALGLEKRDPAS